MGLRAISDLISRLFRRRRQEPGIYTKDILKDTPYELEVGEYTYGRPAVLSWGEGAALRIGKFCSISGGVLIILGGNHRTDWVTTYPFSFFRDKWPEAAGIKGHPATKGDVVIGNDVWISHGATILSGVTIGDGAAIGAKSVVTSDVAPYAIVAGNPAREIKKRFDDETIAALLHIKWWDWPADRIRKNVGLLCSGRVEELVKL